MFFFAILNNKKCVETQKYSLVVIIPHDSHGMQDFMLPAAL